MRVVPAGTAAKSELIVMPLENSILSPAANPPIALVIVPVGDPRINVSGVPGANTIDCPTPNVPSNRNVAPGSMVIDPVPLTAP